MISVEQALEFIKNEEVKIFNTESIEVKKALNRVLSSSIKAPIDLPPYRQSSMDGYAINISGDLSYEVLGEIKAGDNKNYNLLPGTSVRIFTGAAVPDSANAVVIQEKVKRNKNFIMLENFPLENQNIREKGSQIKNGSISLKKGNKLNPAGLGFIQSLGIQNINVYKKPLVTVIVTGNELIPPGNTLSIGKIYESNSLIISAGLEQNGIKPQLIKEIPDNLDATEKVLRKAFDNSDLVLISGGISVGDYDFVGKAMKNLKVQEIFYKVFQRPGKPLYFGKKDKTYCFGLPGNPASTLTCFYVYVIPFLNKLCHNSNIELVRNFIPISHNYSSNETRGLFLKAFINNKKVTILDYQNSSTLISFAKANALVYLPKNSQSIQKNDPVEVIHLPLF